MLFTTGYLTKIGEVKVPDSESYAYKLVIPNKEVREVFILQIQEWFKAVVAKDDDTMKLLSRAILDKDETTDCQAAKHRDEPHDKYTRYKGA